MNKRIRKKQLKKAGHYVDPKELVNLDITIAKFILPRLKSFRKMAYGYPALPGYSYAQWKDDLGKMIDAFEIISSDDWPSNELIGSNREIVDEGLDLFNKFYLSLWW